MQRLGGDCLSRMKCVSAPMRRRFQNVAWGRGLRGARRGQEGRKILRGAIPRQLHLRSKRFRVCWRDVPDRRRKQDEKRLASQCNHKRDSGRPLLDPAISKVRIAEEFFRRNRSAKTGQNAGEELSEAAYPCNPK